MVAAVWLASEVEVEEAADGSAGDDAHVNADVFRSDDDSASSATRGFNSE